MMDPGDITISIDASALEGIRFPDARLGPWQRRALFALRCMFGLVIGMLHVGAMILLGYLTGLDRATVVMFWLGGFVVNRFMVDTR